MMHRLFVFSILISVSCPTLSGLVNVTPGAPPAAIQPSFWGGVTNPDMDDAVPIAQGGDGAPDGWSSGPGFQVGNAKGTGVTHFSQGGYVTQKLDLGAGIDEYWFKVIYKTHSMRVAGSGGNPGTVYDPSITLAWSYAEAPGVIVQDFHTYPGNNPNPAIPSVWTTVEGWGFLSVDDPTKLPTSIDFQFSVTPWADTSVDVDYLNFKVGKYEMPEPSAAKLVLSGLLICLGFRRALIVRARQTQTPSGGA